MSTQAAVTRVAGALVVAALLIAACSGGSDERLGVAVVASEAQADGGGWRSLAAQAEYVEAYDTLAEMGMKADVVVIARATGVENGRRVGLTPIRFEVIRAISEWDDRSVVVEMDEARSSKALEEQLASFPPVVLVLREKALDEAGSYRLVNGHGLWTEQPDGGLFAPMVGDPLDTERFAPELAELTGLEDLADHLEAARRQCDPACGRGPRPTTEPTGG